MLQHLFGMEVCYQERDVISLLSLVSFPTEPILPSPHPNAFLTSQTYLDWLPPQNKESLRSLRQKPGKFMHKNLLNVVCLLDLDANAHAVDAGFD
jgi:hypothetical protein